MGDIIPFTREMARLSIVGADGRLSVVDVDISGPVIEAAKSLNWATLQVEKDGGKVVAVKFGTKQGHQFREEERRRRPTFINGFRRMSSFLRA